MCCLNTSVCEQAPAQGMLGPDGGPPNTEQCPDHQSHEAAQGCHQLLAEPKTVQGLPDLRLWRAVCAGWQTGHCGW